MPNFPINKITPSFWFAKDAEAAAKFYVSVFPDSRIDRVSTMPAESPSGPPGSVALVYFTLCGQSFFAMAAGPLDDFNHALSFTISCDTQEELDRYYEALKAGGSEEQCGWVKDKFGVSWQIVPTVLADLYASPDRESAARAGRAMMKMKKLDIAALQAAAAGTSA